MKIFIITLLFCFSAFASEDHNNEKHNGHHNQKEHKEESTHGHDEGHEHNHSGNKAIGENKAIVEVNEVQGFELSQQAIKTLNIKLISVNKYLLKIPTDSLVISGNKKAVYRFRSGFFKLIEVEDIKARKDGYLVNLKNFKFGDQLVISGVDLLKVSDTYSTDKSEYGHAH